VYLQRKKTPTTATFAEIISIFAKITVQKQQLANGNTLILSNLFTQALLSISEKSAENESVPSKIQAMLEFIRSRVSENITLFDLAQHFGLSKQYVCRLFKQHLNASATETILAYKMTWASEYLEVSALNVNQIAEKLGFENVYYFSRRFKQFYGVSPSEYRKRKA
jgi:two-component system response regulator YesN